MDRKTRIAVVGAGLGGLTAAGFLQRAGFPVNVYEQAPAFSRIGAGIILVANVMKVLRRLGIEDALIAAGIKSQCYISRAWDTGETWPSSLRCGERTALWRSLSQHPSRRSARRAGARRHAGNHRLQSSIGGLAARTAARRSWFSRMARPPRPTLSSAPTAYAPRCANCCSAPEPPQFVGAVAYRAIFPAERLNGLYIPDCTKWWGPDRHFLPYYHDQPARRDLCHRRRAGRGWDSDAASLPSSREALSAILRELSSRTCSACCRRPRTSACGRSSIANATIAGAADGIASARRRLPSDAAVTWPRAAPWPSRTRPSSARCLETFDDPAEAFRCYEATRIPRVADVQRISIENSWMRGPTDTDWFYCYDPVRRGS